MIGAQPYHNATYVDTEESHDTMITRLNKWRSLAICDKIEGKHRAVPAAFDFLQALASMQGNKAVTYGTPPIEYFQQLSYTMKISIIDWFLNYFNDLSIGKPSIWNKVQLVGVQSKTVRGGLDKLRWVGKMAALQKWFLKAVVYTIERELNRPLSNLLVSNERH